jgi:hypothetical protein
VNRFARRTSGPCSRRSCRSQNDRPVLRHSNRVLEVGGQ